MLGRTLEVCSELARIQAKKEPEAVGHWTDRVAKILGHVMLDMCQHLGTRVWDASHKKNNKCAIIFNVRSG